MGLLLLIPSKKRFTQQAYCAVQPVQWAGYGLDNRRVWLYFQSEAQTVLFTSLSALL
jgi:hypothetical protein